MADRLLEEAELQHLDTGLSVRDLMLLPALPPPLEPDELLAVNNLCVALARSAMVRAKKAGAPTTRVRRSLKLPTDWVEHYQAVFLDTSANVLLNPMLQNAMICNEIGGETRPWKSK